VVWREEVLTAFRELAASAGEIQAVESDPADPLGPPGPPDLPGLPGDSVADVATNIWRLRNRMSTLPDGMRSTTRHCEMAWDALAEAGVEIRDHLNDPYDSGLALKVVAFQPTSGLERERVIETIRPSIYLHDQTIQTAEVIVGTPDPPADMSASGTKESRP
jgi:hypothetical protein